MELPECVWVETVALRSSDRDVRVAYVLGLMYITQPGLCQRDLWKGQAFVSCSDARLIDNSQTSLPGALFPVVDPAPLTLFVLSFSTPITSIFVVVILIDFTTLHILLCFGSCVVTYDLTMAF